MRAEEREVPWKNEAAGRHGEKDSSFHNAQ